MPEEYVVPYVDEKRPQQCSVCGLAMVVGLTLMERVMRNVRPKGYVCIKCIARMWNTPDAGTPVEPTAEERADGTPIIEMKKDQPE